MGGGVRWGWVGRVGAGYRAEWLEKGVGVVAGVVGVHVVEVGVVVMGVSMVSSPGYGAITRCHHLRG